jgi:hypothetical protein
MPERLCRGVRALGAQMSQSTIGLPGPAPHTRCNFTAAAGFPSSSSGVPSVRPGPVSAATTLWSPPRLPMRPATPTRIKSRRVYRITPPAPWACGPVLGYLDSSDALTLRASLCIVASNIDAQLLAVLFRSIWIGPGTPQDFSATNISARLESAGDRLPPAECFTGAVHFVAQRLPAQLPREVRGSR